MADDTGAPTPDDAAPPPATPRAGRRLVRSRTDKVIAGVAGGLGEYLGVDPVLIRIALVALVLLGFGTGVLLYVIMWLVVPEEGDADVHAKRDRPPSHVSSESAAFIVGGLLILFGAVWLARMFIPYFFELRIIGPLVLLAVGVAIVAQGVRR